MLMSVLYLLCFYQVTYIFHHTNALQIELQRHKRYGCLPSDISFLTLIEISIQQCATECVIRPKCNALKYKRRFQLCELIEHYTYNNLISEWTEKADCLVIKKSDMTSTELPTGCHECTSGQTCDLDKEQCVIKECEHIDLTHGNVFGNMKYVGSAVKYTCNVGYEQVSKNSIVTCGADGLWHPTPGCVTAVPTLKNVALNKPTSMSSVADPSFGSHLAVDGHTDTDLNLGESCFSTNIEHNPWWQVDLQAVYKLSIVRVFYKLECCVARQTGLIMVVGETLEMMNEVAYHTGPTSEIAEFSLIDNVEARYVKLTLNGSDSLKICEVQVFGSLRDPTIGTVCANASECDETEAECIPDGAGGQRCFCNRLYRYNNLTRDCEQACTKMSDVYTIYNNLAILYYNAHTYSVSSSDECERYCAEDTDCLAYEFVGNKCQLGQITYQMIQDAHPQALKGWNGITLFTKECP